MLRAHVLSPRLVVRFVLVFALALAFISAVSSRTAHADYNGGQLISDSVFLDSAAMSANNVQSFLNSKGGGIASMSFVLNCDVAGAQAKAIYLSLNAPCNQSISAARIIHYASQVYGINPQVILATMQKEQSLVTAANPTAWQLERAMGYGCPTSGGCQGASTFFYQIDNGAWVLRYHYERARGNLNWWSPSDSWTCGSSKNFYKPNLYPNQNVKFYDEDNVLYRTHFIANAATSAFYCYTPHAYNNPNGLYGLPRYGTTGRYYTGSYNFVKFFELWFGTTVKEKVIAVTYDANTDNTGEIATIGLRLSSKPTSNVIVGVRISSPENARIMSGITEVVIGPKTWNSPKHNKVYIAGLGNDSLTGTVHYKLDLMKPVSNDPAYSNLSPTSYPDVFLTHQNTSHSRTVHRLFKSDTGMNIFTANVTEKAALLTGGWQDKGLAFSYCPAGDQTVLRLRKGPEKKLVVDNSTLHTESLEAGYELDSVSFAVSTQGTVPIYWFHNEETGDNFYTTSSSPMAGYESMGRVFYACDPQVEPVYRLRNEKSGSYMFTSSPKERKEATTVRGFSKYEGAGFYVCPTGTDVFRLYRPSTNSYAYTTSAADRDFLVANNRFQNDGAKFKLCTGGTREVYGLYDPTIGVHFYTTSEYERDDFDQNVNGYKWLSTPFLAK